MTISGSFRGGLQVANTLYGAWEDELYRINDSGDRILIGTLSGTDKIFIASNNATTPGVAIVTDVGPFTLDVNTNTIAAYTLTDSDVGSPTCVRTHLGYFMFGYGNGDIQASDLNSYNLNTLNKARTETNPDGVMNIVSYNGQMYVFGNKTIEVWGDPTNASGFPLTRVGYNILPGLHSPNAVAGWEPEFGNPMIYVGADNTIRQLNGYSPDKISPPELDALIAGIALNDQIDALAYVARGHAFWQINGPDFSWVFNCNNQKWHERRSYLSTRSNLTSSVPAFDRWLVGSTASTDLLSIDFEATTEGGDYLIAQMESQNVLDFPNRQRVGRADFNFTVGIGQATGTDPMQTDPTVLIEWSDDGGQSWSTPWWRKLGRQDITQQRVTVLNTGQAGPMGRRWRWTVSDPVWVGFLGSTMDTEVRAK